MAEKEGKTAVPSCDNGVSSPVLRVEPSVRALATFMYGVVVHFGTMLFLQTTAAFLVVAEGPSSCPSVVVAETTSSWWATALLAHEYWVYLQHFNVLGNPLCQRLDRQYGIALLKSNQHWAIAGTLSAYWCRETISIFLCLQLLSEMGQYLALYSLIYHTFKSRGVRHDAMHRYSSTFGIMRQVIDKFYHHNMTERIVSVVRLMLQGVDTLIHAVIIRDLLQSGNIRRGAIDMLHRLFAIWVFHAAMNQFFRCSTATLMVQAWYSMTSKSSSSSNSRNNNSSDDTPTPACELSDDDDDETDGEVDDSTTKDDNDTDGMQESSGSGDNNLDKNVFIVRHLLRPGRVADELKGKRGAASRGVNGAILVETLLAILATVHVVGIGNVPSFSAVLFAEREKLDGTFSSLAWLYPTVPYAWLLCNILFAASGFFFPVIPKKRLQGQIPSKALSTQFLINCVDVLILVIGTAFSTASRQVKIFSWFLGVGVTAKAFSRTGIQAPPKVFRSFALYIEVLGKGFIARSIFEECSDSLALVGSFVSVSWAIITLCRPSSTEQPLNNKPVSAEIDNSNFVDLAFLGHPVTLNEVWALWLIPYSLDKRWTQPWWSIILWPVHYAIGYYGVNWRRKLYGDRGSFVCADDILYGRLRMQNWVGCHFARHFVTSKRAVKWNIEATARYAEASGVKVLCLGALNKAESVNRGGIGVAHALGPKRKLSIIHGNHLTAAAVVQTTRQSFGEKAKVFLTGASSKVGWAVAQALKGRYGYDVLCHSTDESRRQMFKENGFLAASSLEEGTLFSNLWIVGKYDPEVAKTIPQGSTAIVFAVPHPLEKRRDVRVIEGGTLHLDLSKLNQPFKFTNKLAKHEMFACNAAGFVTAQWIREGRVDGNGRVDELGKVDHTKMDEWLHEATKLGFKVPIVCPVDKTETHPHDISQFISTGLPPVVVIGGGAAGLAVSASLRRRGIMSIILEEQAEAATFGSWNKHFSGLEITTQKKWCNLPGFKISNYISNGENVSGQQYQRYLQLYAARFDLDIRRGHRVTNITCGDDGNWIVECKYSSLAMKCSAVVVATGKHRIPNHDTAGKLLNELQDAGIGAIHTTDLKEKNTWNAAVQAASRGGLCVVGFGNSAADVCRAIMEKIERSGGGGDDDDDQRPCIHVAARTVPPVFPQRKSFLRIDTIAYILRQLPAPAQEGVFMAMQSLMPGCVTVDAAFPSYLPRWGKIKGRVPVIDKHCQLVSAFASGSIVGHGPITSVDTAGLRFADGNSRKTGTVKVDMVIMATGYKRDCLVGREDRLNGLYRCGFTGDKFLPLVSIGEEAESIARDISSQCRR